MKKSTTIILVLLLLLISACSSNQAEDNTDVTAAQADTATEKTAVSVEVADVETGSISLIYSYTGDLQAKDEVNLIPATSGRIKSVLVEVGDEVKTGDTIVLIKRDRLLAQRRQSKAILAIAKLNLKKMKQGSRPEEIALSNANVELVRAALKDVSTIDDNERTKAAAELARTQSDLHIAQAAYDKIAWAGDVGTTTQAATLEKATISYENALAKYNIDTTPSDKQLVPLMIQLAQAELNAIIKKEPFRPIDFEIAKMRIEQAQAAVDLTNIQLDETTIKAPFDGIIAELYVTKGSIANQQAGVALLSSKKLEISIEVEESRIGQITEGKNAALQVTAHPGKNFPAIVTTVSPTADKNTRTFTVKITPLKADGLLKGGMFADVSVLIKEKQNTTLVPRSAVTLVNNQDTVYVVKSGQVQQRSVTTGLFDTDRIEILSGLKPGETVVIAGQPNLTDGVKVEVVNRL